MTELLDVMKALMTVEQAVPGIERVYLTQPMGQQEPEFPCIWNLQRLGTSAYGINAGRKRRYTLSQYIVLGKMADYSEELAESGLRLEQAWFDTLQANVKLGGVPDIDIWDLRARDDNPQGIGASVSGASLWFGHVTEFDVDIDDVGTVGP